VIIRKAHNISKEVYDLYKEMQVFLDGKIGGHEVSRIVHALSKCTNCSFCENNNELNCRYPHSRRLNKVCWCFNPITKKDMWSLI
jgi:hypothetical protein